MNFGDARPAGRLVRYPRVGVAVGSVAWLLAVAAPDSGAAPVGPAPGAGAVLVMPFERTGGDPPSAWLGEGIALIVTDTLRLLGVDALSRDERVAMFEQLDLAAGASLSRATTLRAAEVSGAAWLVVGSFEVTGERLTVQARVIDLRAGRQGPELVESASLGDLFGLGDRLARRLGLGGRSAGADAAVGAGAPPALEAFEAYVKGLLAETAASQHRFLERALEAAPAYDRARLALWRVHSEQGDHATALAVVRQVARGAPEGPTARFAATLSLVALGRLDEAFAELKALRSEHPAAAVSNNLGVVQLKRGGAASGGSPTYFLTQAVEADPGTADYAFNLGYAYAWQRDWDGARYWLHEAVRLNPADADAHFVLGAALEATGARTEAARERELARRLSARYEQAGPDDGPLGVPPGLERLARGLETPRLRRVDRAVLGARQREQGELARFYLERAQESLAAHRVREAIVELQRAVYLSPYLAEAHLLLGRAYAQAGRTRAAIDALTVAVWLRDSVETRLALARAYLQAREWQAARAEAERVLALDPGSAEARAVLAEVARAATGGRPEGGSP